MKKVDFKKTRPDYKAKKGQFDICDVPAANFLMIDGGGGPASEEFTAALETLYPVAYALKFFSKLTLERDYVVPPLEALWWADDMAVFTTSFDQSQWDWTAMIMLPEWISAGMVEETIQKVRDKKAPPSIELLRCAEFSEGLCVQTLHIGSYSDEGEVLKQMHESFIPESGYNMRGKHHEIYFNDFRRVAPEKLKTLLRQPIASVN